MIPFLIYSIHVHDIISLFSESIPNQDTNTSQMDEGPSETEISFESGPVAPEPGMYKKL